MNTCRRCKNDFTPNNNEARCTSCLSKRRANRVEKRKSARLYAAENHKADKAMRAMDGMMRRNGLDSNRSVRLIG